MLEQIKEANDIKLIDPSEYRELAREIPRFLVRKVSRTGGHLASNLGVVELTMAMHLCCDLPEDKIVWDVGHQCYTHKILTGRQDAFDSLRQYGGMSGFPKRGESECDAMDTGHSSTSISAALGLAKARDLQGRHNKIFAVIGDGALSGGMAYEALNNAARLRSNMIIVLNDNQMSISKNVGGMSNYLGKIRTDTNYTELKQDVENALEKLPHFGNRLTERIRGVKDLIKRIFIPGMLFEDMGITYIGPIDGHDIGQMVTAFNSASKLNAAVIVHVVTQKGKGYPPAQKDPSSFHGVGPFRVSDGTLLHSKKDVPTYTKVFQNVIDGDASNEYLPHQYKNTNCLVYGGTHDNQTLLGYYGNKSDKELKFMMNYLHIKRVSQIPKAMLRAAYASIADTVIFQMQDILELDDTARMNEPSTVGTNWRWRMQPGAFDGKKIKMLRKMCKLYAR